MFGNRESGQFQSYSMGTPYSSQGRDNGCVDDKGGGGAGVVCCLMVKGLK